MQELCDKLDDNIWFNYLWIIYIKGIMKGINWIDFESEISHIIEQIDRYQENHPDGSVSAGALFYVFCLALKSALARQYKVSPSIFAV